MHLNHTRLLTRGFSALLAIVLSGCATTLLDANAFKASGVQHVGIVIGSSVRGRAGMKGPWFPEEIYAPVSRDLENSLNDRVFARIESALTRKGYEISRRTATRIEWDVYANIQDSVASYTQLLQRYGITPEHETVDAVLIAEYLLQPKTWGAEQIASLTLNTFEVTYAKSKIWIYDLRTGKRLFFSSIQRGYDQVLSHVNPDDALDEILSLNDIPHARR